MRGDGQVDAKVRRLGCGEISYSGSASLFDPGGYPPEFIAHLKSRGISWFANTSTEAESIAAEAAGADVVVAQGMEAGGHRGCFDARNAELEMVGLASLIPAVVDAPKIPVVATGGIADGRRGGPQRCGITGYASV